MTLGLIRRVKGNALDAVLAHECGHILCQHVLYQTLANAIFSFGESFSDSLVGMVGNVAIKPIRQALIAWSRASELSADSVACAVNISRSISTRCDKNKYDFKEHCRYNRHNTLL